MAESYVTRLHNYLQEHGQPASSLTWAVSFSGPADRVLWTAVCKVGGQVLGSGTARQLQVAKQQAAQLACEKLGI